MVTERATEAGFDDLAQPGARAGPEERAKQNVIRQPGRPSV